MPGAAVPLDVHVDLDFPNGDDLALSRGTDFYGLDELLTDRRVAPAAAGFWERAEFPGRAGRGIRQVGIAGASIVGDGCLGVSYLAEGMIAAELARGDGSIATLNAVHSGLAMTAIAMLGSAEQRARYLPRMATCEVRVPASVAMPAMHSRSSCSVRLGVRSCVTRIALEPFGRSTGS